jgi:hypothetical protein
MGLPYLREGQKVKPKDVAKHRADVRRRDALSVPGFFWQVTSARNALYFALYFALQIALHFALTRRYRLK